MGMLKEFRDFAFKGNMLDMAVGIIIGAAFGGVVTSMVNDLITPLLSLLTGGVDFSGRALELTTGLEGAKPVTLKWGSFVQTFIDFLIKAYAIFLVVKGINTAKQRFIKEQAAAPGEPTAEVKLLTEIRDALRR